MSVILHVSCWSSSLLCLGLFSDGVTSLSRCWKLQSFHTHVVRAKYCLNPLMPGTTVFPFLALYLASAGLGRVPSSGRRPYLLPSIKSKPFCYFFRYLMQSYSIAPQHLVQCKFPQISSFRGRSNDNTLLYWVSTVSYTHLTLPTTPYV